MQLSGADSNSTPPQCLQSRRAGEQKLKVLLPGWVPGRADEVCSLRSFFLDAGFLMFGQVYGVKVTRLSWVVFLTFPDYLGNISFTSGEIKGRLFMGNAIPTAS